MNLVIVHLRLLARRLGLPGLAGVALALGAVLGAAIEIPARDAALAALGTEVRRLESAARIARTSGTAAPASAAEQLAQFHAKLPPVAEAIVLIGKLNEAAAASELKLQSAEYRLVPVPGARVVRYQVALPMVGTYPQIRKFVAATLRALPTASIDEITMKRESIQASRVETQLKLTVLLAAPPAGDAVSPAPPAGNATSEPIQGADS